MTFFLGAACGLFAGTFMGVLLTCVLVASKREPELRVTPWREGVRHG